MEKYADNATYVMRENAHIYMYRKWQKQLVFRAQ
jgi:hypothetical protein